MYHFTVAFQNGSNTFRLHKVAILSCIYQKYKKEITFRQCIYIYIVTNGYWTRSRPNI